MFNGSPPPTHGLRAALAHRRAERARGLEAARAACGDPSLPVAAVPYFEAPLVRLPRARRHAFVAHLVRVVREAFASDASEGVPNDHDGDAPATLGRACGACGGFCCTHGGDRAFLTADTLRRYRALHPDATRVDAVRDYASRLGVTRNGSCVFHGAHGCTLPREMRSDTCNRYWCGALADLRRGHVEHAFVAAVDGGRVVRSTLLD